jgi:hypothetical protein
MLLYTLLFIYIKQKLRHYEFRQPLRHTLLHKQLLISHVINQYAGLNDIGRDRIEYTVAWPVDRMRSFCCIAAIAIAMNIAKHRRPAQTLGRCIPQSKRFLKEMPRATWSARACAAVRLTQIQQDNLSVGQLAFPLQR